MQQATCMKCKTAPAVATVRQKEPYCHNCIEIGVQQRCLVSTKGLGLISPGDAALLALSGGAASTALLYCMAAMQAPADAVRPIRGKLPYKLSVLHIDCSMQQGVTPQQAANNTSPDHTQLQQLQALLAVLATAAGYSQQPLLLHLSDAFCTEQQLQQLLAHQQQQGSAQDHACNGSSASLVEPTAQHANAQQPQQPQPPQQQQQQQHLQRLQQLVAAISDATGREDIITHLRDQLLLRAAAVLGCNRLLRADCASRIAVRVIADASKGRGFSLPADIHSMDGRLMQHGGPCVLQPFRDITHKELRELCRYKGLPLLQEGSGSSGSSAGGLGSGSSSSMNVLAERFVGEMESSLPISIYTILRTAAHLEPFEFTDAAAMVPKAADALKKHHSHRQQQQQVSGGEQQVNGQPRAAEVQWRLCGICNAPLPARQPAPAGPAEGDAGSGSGHAAHEGNNGVAAAGDGSMISTCSSLCYSCDKQILQQVQLVPAAAPGKALSLNDKMQRLRQLLPPGILLDCDSGDETDS
jgi:tRNA(Ile)-lysidine synthase TilS/MesJ